MEFHEKLRELRKSKGLTQEELAEALYVSRTAISKWEAGRGYPNIESLKQISNYFSVTIDDLLSGEKLISIAEEENKSNIQTIYELLFGIADLFSVLLIILPLYPNIVNGYVYSVNLFAYVEIASWNYFVHWTMFIILIGFGVVKIVLTKLKIKKKCKSLMIISISFSILVVLFLAMAREAYAIAVAFLLLVIKGILFLIFERV